MSGPAALLRRAQPSQPAACSRTGQGELAGSALAVQDALGHRNAATTRVFLPRVALKRDKHSRGIAQRLGVGRA